MTSQARLRRRLAPGERMTSKPGKPPHLFERWIQRQMPVTSALATEVKRVLEPMMIDRGYGRVNFRHGDKKSTVYSFMMAFERSCDDGWFDINIMFEKRGRPLFVCEFHFWPRAGPKAGFPTPRLERNPRRSGFGSWYGVRFWFAWHAPVHWWQQRIEGEVQLAAQHLPQVFDYLEVGVIGPNVWDMSGGRASAAYHRGGVPGSAS